MGVLSRQTSSGTVSWYLSDRLGTDGKLIDNSGNILDHVDFSAFGVVLGETNPSVGDRMMGYAGLERDSITGLNLAVMRIQNPGTGRWTTQDPLSFAAGDGNLYRYVGNGATEGADPEGLILGLGVPSWDDYWYYLTHPFSSTPTVPFVPPPPVFLGNAREKANLDRLAKK